MSLSADQRPTTDPTPLFELFRGAYATELLTAAVAHFDVFGRVVRRPLSVDQLRAELNLEVRPSIVLTTALRAMGLLQLNEQSELTLTPVALEHLAPGAYFHVGDYIGLAAGSPGVLEMVERLRTNRPAGADEEQGAAFIYQQGMPSAMEDEQLARHFTLALAGRAKNVAPVLAEKVPLDGVNTLLDVGGGTGIYSIALLQNNPDLKAIVLDRPEVLRLARQFAADYAVNDRLECRPGDMFTDELPRADVMLLSNVLHDWDVPECRRIVQRCADALPPGGRLLIHDVLLGDALDGPLPTALYSAALFTLTKGRAYSGAEFRGFLTDAGLVPQPVLPTLIHCHVLQGVKPA
jgi:predicted O-methyltransferase YrrM